MPKEIQGLKIDYYQYLTYKIENGKVDLASNFFSLGEMRRLHFENYTSSKLFKMASSKYLVKSSLLSVV